MFPDCEFEDWSTIKGSDIPVIITFLPTSLVATSARALLYSTSAISGIDGCEKIAGMKIQQYRFAAIAKDNLVRDMANGGGEYVTALAYLQGCPIEFHSRYAEMTQLSFHQIFPSSQTGPKTILSNLETEIVKDPLLAKACIWVS